MKLTAEQKAAILKDLDEQDAAYRGTWQYQLDELTRVLRKVWHAILEALMLR